MYEIQKPRRTISIASVVLLGAIVTLSLGALLWHALLTGGVLKPQAIPAAPTPSPFLYSFSVDGVLDESSSQEKSTSPYFWLNSGGQLVIASGTGMTLQGDIPPQDPWHGAYAQDNPADTDLGVHPQNLFRLLTRSSWGNVDAQVDFLIVKDHFSTSTNRNDSNGVLLMSRYQDGNTLYYAGVRVDGTAVIKKKYHGRYYTMAQKKIFVGSYSRDMNENLISHAVWLTLRTRVITNPQGQVVIELFLSNRGERSEMPLLEAQDTGQYGNTAPITDPGLVGIRTDFMDVQFQNLRLETII
jgi:hypothetical protein